MGIKDVFNQAPSPEEEALYKQVLDEVESGVMRKGIYAKALADGLGDEGKAQSLYIKYRVQSLAEELKSAAELEKMEQIAEQKKVEEFYRVRTEEIKLAKAEQKSYEKLVGDRPFYIAGFIVLIILIIVLIWF
jgi:hypothetical protein